MRWVMRKEFKEAYSKAKSVLKELGCQMSTIISTVDILKTVEKLTKTDVKIKYFDFAKMDERLEKSYGIAKCGAAMYVTPDQDDRKAVVLLNTRETAEMQRFSLVHELGHLMLNNMNTSSSGFLFSTHIDMDITSFNDEDWENNKLLMEEQLANVFALLVLIPYDMLLKAMKKYDSIDDIAKLFGVEKNAVISRIMLGVREEA